MKIKFYILVILKTTTFFAQQNQVETKIDKKINKIGAQFNLTLKTTVDTLSTVVFPNTKSFGKLEVIRNYVIDTVRKDDKYDLIKRYGLTQFDSGRYVIPKMTVLINKKPFLSDSISVDVKDVLVDTLKQKMYDIKPIAQVENPSSNWRKYVLGILLIIGIGFLIYYLLKKYQKQKTEEIVYKTPIEKAIGMLKILETKQLWQKGEIKNYYSELTDIARDYIEEVIEIPAKESTTSELIAGLRKASNVKKLNFTKQSLSNLENVLRQADLVKFAKVQPSDNQIEEDYKRIEKSIISLHQSIPTEEIEDENAEFDAELKKKKALKKQRTNRIILTIVLMLFLLSGTAIYFVTTKGFSFVKDNIIGHPTKELLESNWITSDYGNPVVTIETPKVLKRIEIPNLKSDPSIASRQQFLYGSVVENFFINVITTGFKQEIKPKLEDVIALEAKGFEAQFKAKNIQLNQEEFKTSTGIAGRKASGTMTVLNPLDNKEIALAFECLVFNEQGGLQEVIIVHRPNDIYANQIIARVLNSVELKPAKQ
jgi:hypothetical protein